MNMLAYSKQQKPEFEMVNIPKLLNEVIVLVKTQFDAKQVMLLTDFDDRMPPIPLDADGIHQAVLNLINNALDAVEPTEGVVSVSCLYDQEVHCAKIMVVDNGSGIASESSRQLFTPFYSTKGLRGTGLGLAVSKKIVQEHGGRITTESSPKKGATFTMVLPASAESAPSCADTHGPASKLGAESSTASE